MEESPSPLKSLHQNRVPLQHAPKAMPFAANESGHGTLMAWAEKHGFRLEHIQPGRPQQNAYIER